MTISWCSNRSGDLSSAFTESVNGMDESDPCALFPEVLVVHFLSGSVRELYGRERDPRSGREGEGRHERIGNERVCGHSLPASRST